MKKFVARPLTEGLLPVPPDPQTRALVSYAHPTDKSVYKMWGGQCAAAAIPRKSTNNSSGHRLNNIKIGPAYSQAR